MRRSHRRATTNDCRPTINAPDVPQSGLDLLAELEALRKAISGDVGSAEDRLELLAASVGRLVDQLPLEDPLGVGERLSGALTDLSTALTRCPDGRGPTASVTRTRARAIIAEVGYLVGLCQQFHYGRPEQTDSTISRIDAMTGALSAP